jgi:gliding motility-associated-like protein
MYKKKLTCSLLILFSVYFSFAQAPGCPNVTINAPGSSQGQVTIPCNDCITLTANALVTGLTNTYTVSSIPYAPPYPYNSGSAVFVNSDDVWSPVVTIPFDFCYFGNYYTQLVTGANGVISFDLSNASGYCPWSFSNTCPSPSLILNAIFGPYHDIDPGVGGAVYQGVLGSYPCRTFVMNFNQVPMFSGSCNYMLATHQIVLYEATNVIEVYIQNAPLCATWNSGNKLIGIQNATGTVGYTPPGRNTGPWSATNEAWRFTPNGASNYTIQWYEGAVPIGTGTSITVCPTVPTTYTAIATYDNCNYTQFVVTNDMTVNPGNLTLDINPTLTELCAGESVSITTTASGNGPFTYAWSPGTGLSSTTNSTVTATPPTTTTYTVTVTDALQCSGTIETTVNVNQLPAITLTASENPICVGQSSEITAGGGETYVWNSLNPGASHIVSPTATTSYSVTGTDMNGCTGTADISLQVNPGPVITITNPSPDICDGETVVLMASGADVYEWSTADMTDQITVTPLVHTTYQVTGTDVNGCVGTAETEILVHDIPVVDFIGNPLEGCIPLNVNFTSQIVSDDAINSYNWLFGGGSFGTSTLANPNKIFSQAGTYDVSLTVITEYGCTETETKPAYITAFPKPSASFIADPAIIELGSGPVQFIDQSGGATMWLWTFGDGNHSSDSNPLHFYETAGQFNVVLIVSNEHGCIDSTWRYVQILHNISFYVPNAFTPGTDGINDEFGPTGVGIKAIDFAIYDRWGKMVFFSNTMEKKWDGRIDGRIPNSTTMFVWKANVIYANNLKETFTGNVLLIR